MSAERANSPKSPPPDAESPATIKLRDLASDPLLAARIGPFSADCAEHRLRVSALVEGNCPALKLPADLVERNADLPPAEVGPQLEQFIRREFKKCPVRTAVAATIDDAEGICDAAVADLEAEERAVQSELAVTKRRLVTYENTTWREERDRYLSAHLGRVACLAGAGAAVLAGLVNGANYAHSSHIPAFKNWPVAFCFAAGFLLTATFAAKLKLQLTVPRARRRLIGKLVAWVLPISFVAGALYVFVMSGRMAGGATLGSAGSAKMLVPILAVVGFFLETAFPLALIGYAEILRRKTLRRVESDNLRFAELTTQLAALAAALAPWRSLQIICSNVKPRFAAEEEQQVSVMLSAQNFAYARLKKCNDDEEDELLESLAELRRRRVSSSHSLSFLSARS